jgi:hypothetical protein
MTLRRKNLAPHQLIVGMYAAMLVSGFCVTTYDLIHEVGTLAHGRHGPSRTTATHRRCTATAVQGCFFLCHILGNCGFLLRLGARWSKYSVWAGRRRYSH